MSYFSTGCLTLDPLDSSLRWNDGVVDSSVSRYPGMTGWWSRGFLPVLE